jgi:hypothetical protein
MCDVVVCDEQVVLPIAAPQDGLYEMELDFLDGTIRKSAMLSSGDPLTFETLDLDETYTFVGRAIGPDGAALTFTKDGTVYDCFEFTTKRIAQWTPSTSSSAS